MTCERRASTVRLRRGELGGALRDEAASHALSCAECRAELGEPEPDIEGSLTDLASGPPTRVDRPGGAPAFLPGPGAVVDHFVLGERIGRGAFGQVYRAQGPGGAPVAIKVIPADRCDESVRRRFRREAEAVASLSHPGIVAVVAHGATEDGGLYLATELLDGEDLSHRLARGPLSADETARIGVSAAAALGAAHHAGVVHRDVKPANLWLCRDGRVKLLDFGLAIRVAGDVDPRFTSSDVLIGTPAYMAPEQAEGAGSEDALTDVWGLGATLYHAVAGRPPFQAPTPMSLLVRVVTGEPSPLPGDVPSFLRAALAGALARDRASRTPSMRALARALEEGIAAGSDGAHALATGAPLAVPLGDEVRIVSALLAEDVTDLDAFAAAVRAQNGRPSPLMGRRGVGLFGGEVWNGDEAERAVRAGLAIRSAKVASRVGVATGRAIRREAGEVTGEVVASAEAVLTGAGVGVDAETRRRTRGGFVLEDGVVARARSGQGVVGVRGLGGADVPIVGRARELQDLLLTLDHVVEHREALGVLLVGPPGIGKSRLRHALTARLAEESRQIVVLEARGESHRGLEGWHAIANALRGWAELPEGTPAATVRKRLLGLCPHRLCAELLAEMLGAPFDEPLLPARARGDPGAMRDRMLVAVGDLLESLAAAQPVLLLVEDVHWADGPSLDCVEVLLRRLEGSPVLVLATSRPEGEVAAGTALPDLRRVVLGGLSRAETRVLVSSVLGEPPVAPVDADAIFERSGGNPYFVEELVLSVREGRRDLPASVEAVVQARLDALPRRDKDLVRRASVLGRRFWAEALAAMGEDDPAPGLQRLRRAELVAVEPRSRLLGASEWRFRHAIVQEVALASLTEEQRATLHRGAAEWLAARPDARPAEVAQHFEHAGAESRALPFWRRAAERAFSEGAAELGLEASGRAIARETDRRAAFRLRHLRVEALQFLGRLPEAEAEIALLGELADTSAEQVQAAAWRSRNARLRGRRDEAERAIELGRDVDPDAPDLLIELAWICCWTGRLDEAVALARQAAARALSRGDEVAHGRALNALSQALFESGFIAEALETCERMVAVVEALGDPRFIAAARGFLASTELRLGRVESAVIDLDRARKLNRASKNRRFEGWVLHNLGLAQAWMGLVEEGLASERAALTIAREVDEPRLGHAAREYVAAILLQAGQPEAALEVLDELLGAGASEMMQTEFRALRAEALVQLGRIEEARTEAERALAARAAAGSMWEFEAVLFLAAHRAGIDGALLQGRSALDDKARRIEDPELRRSFLERVPEHARLIAAAQAEALQ